MFVRNKTLSFGEYTDNNILLIGDNLDCLEYLLNEYENKIDVIYIDPPYGLSAKKRVRTTGYDHLDTNNLIDFLEKRLVLAKKLLSDDGSIWITMDTYNIAKTRILMDKIFLENNFLIELIRLQNCCWMSFKKPIINQHDITLGYGKTKNVFIKGYGEIENHKKYSNPDNDPNGKWIKTQLERKNTFSSQFQYTITNPYTGESFRPKEDREWHFSEQSFYKQVELGRVVFLKEKAKKDRYSFYIKSYLKDCKHKENFLKSLDTAVPMYSSNHGVKELISIGIGRIFSYPKPVSFVKKILAHTTKKNSIVLDFFAGSGTTGHAVLEMNREDGGNRKFILCQLNEKTQFTPNGIPYDVTIKRLKRIMTGECYDGSNRFDWVNKNNPYGGSLTVLERS